MSPALLLWLGTIERIRKGDSSENDLLRVIEVRVTCRYNPLKPSRALPAQSQTIEHDDLEQEEIKLPVKDAIQTR